MLCLGLLLLFTLDEPDTDLERRVEALVAAGKTAQAISELEKVVESDPRAAGAGFLLCELYLEGGRRAEASRVLEKARYEHPGTAQGYRLKARLDLEANHSGRALTTVRAGLGRHPRDVGLRRLELRCLLHAKRFEEASAMLERDAGFWGEHAPLESARVECEIAWQLRDGPRLARAVGSWPYTTVAASVRYRGRLAYLEEDLLALDQALAKSDESDTELSDLREILASNEARGRSQVLFSTVLGVTLLATLVLVGFLMRRQRAG